MAQVTEPALEAVGRLREAARAAPFKHLHVSGGHSLRDDDGDEILHSFANVVGYIALANPAMILALLDERDRLREALEGDREVKPLHPDCLDRILEFEERVGQLAGPNDTASLTWADQRALIAEAVLAYRARAALAPPSTQKGGEPPPIPATGGES